MSEFFKHPFILVLTSVLVGTWLFGHMNYQRTKRDLRREKSIQFLEEVGAILNRPLTYIFGQLRGDQNTFNANIVEFTAVIFENRLMVRVKSEGLLDSDDFWKNYEKIMWEIAALGNSIREIYNGNNNKIEIEKANFRYENLIEYWDIEPVLDSSRSELYPLLRWGNCIWAIIHNLLLNELKKSYN